MKKITIVFLLFLFNNVNAQINIRNIEFRRGENPETIITTTVIDSEVFEIDLVLMPKGNFKASKDILELSVQNPDYSEFFVLTNENNEILFFKSSTEFLNFMNDKGYKAVMQNKTKYRTEYVFNLK